MIGGEENESVFFDGGEEGEAGRGGRDDDEEGDDSDGRCMTDVFFFYSTYLLREGRYIP